MSLVLVGLLGHEAAVDLASTADDLGGHLDPFLRIGEVRHHITLGRVCRVGRRRISTRLIAAFVGQLVEVHVHHVVGVLAKPVRRGILYLFRLAGRIETASNGLAINLDLVNLVLRIGLVPLELPISAIRFVVGNGLAGGSQELVVATIAINGDGVVAVGFLAAHRGHHAAGHVHGNLMISRKALEAEAVPSNVNRLAINFDLRHAALAAHIPRNGGIVARRHRLGRIDRAVARAVATVAAVDLRRHGVSLAGHIGLGGRCRRRIIGIRRSNSILGEFNHDVHVGRQGALHLVGTLRNQVVAHHAINHHLGDMAAICCLPRHRRLRALLLLQRRRNRASSRTLRSHIHVQVAVVVQAQLQHGTAGNRTFKHVVRAIRIEPVGRTLVGDLRLLVHFGYRNRLLGRSCIRLGKRGHRAIHRVALGVLRTRVVQVTHRIVGIIARRPFCHERMIVRRFNLACAVGSRIR